MCAEWEQAFLEVAQAAKAQQPNEKLAFGIVRFDTLQEVFRSYNLNYAPLIIYVAHDQKETKSIIPKLTMNLANLVSFQPVEIQDLPTLTINPTSTGVGISRSNRAIRFTEVQSKSRDYLLAMAAHIHYAWFPPDPRSCW